eukprot:463744_1
MMASLDTLVEGEMNHQFDFNQWIMDNQLNDVKQLFIKHNMKDPDALNTVSDEFHNLMSDPKLLEKGHLIPAILTALKKVTKPKVIKILISKEEQEAQARLNKYQNKISSLSGALSKLNNKLTSEVKECETQIESLFNEIITTVHSKKNEITNKLKNIEQQKRTEISNNCAKINNEQKNINDAINKVLLLQQNENINMTKRAQTIVSMVDNILSEEISDGLISVDTKIEVKFEKDSISSFVQAICDVQTTQNENDEKKSEKTEYEIDKQIDYNSDSDKGIIYFFGTNFGQNEKWINPAKNCSNKIKTSDYERERGSNEIVVIPSTHFSGGYYNAIGRFGKNNGVQCGTTSPDPNPSFTFDFGEFEINPKAYSIRHGYKQAYCLRHWNFEGSNDRKNWTLISKHENDTTIQNWNEMKTFKINRKINQYFNAFRIFKTGKCSSGTDHLMMCGFEVYGHLILKKNK